MQILSCLIFFPLNKRLNKFLCPLKKHSSMMVRTGFLHLFIFLCPQQQAWGQSLQATPGIENALVLPVLYSEHTLSAWLDWKFPRKFHLQRLPLLDLYEILQPIPKELLPKCVSDNYLIDKSVALVNYNWIKNKIKQNKKLSQANIWRARFRGVFIKP